MRARLDKLRPTERTFTNQLIASDFQQLKQHHKARKTHPEPEQGSKTRQLATTAMDAASDQRACD